MLRTYAVTAIAALGLTANGLLAQTPDNPQQDTVYFVGHRAAITPMAGNVDFVAGIGSIPGEAVKGQPYSAESVTEMVQVLADGNRITRENRAIIYRDSAGRTRREQTLDSIGVWQPAGQGPLTMTTIDDPVAGVGYFLDPVNKTARQFRSMRMQAQLGGATAAAMVTLHDVHGSEAVGVTIEEPAELEESFELPLPPHPVPPHAVLGAAPAIRMAHMGAHVTAGANVVTEDLGEQVLQGLTVRGTRSIHTIEAGAIGNERPLEIVSEQWYSSELGLLVSQRHSDPRFGETGYRLVSVDRSEPPPELFSVPQDYALQEAGVPPRAMIRAFRPDAGTEPAE
jgi:hypothetical protein